MKNYSIAALNQKFRTASPLEIIKWVIAQAQQPVITTNFGPYSATLLHAVSLCRPEIPVIWGDSGYNLTATYKYAHALKNKLDLSLHVYVPQYTRGYIDASFGDYMSDKKGQEAFTELVKIEPLQRAFEEFTPDVWFTNIRKDQTAHRASLDIFSQSESGILKISPFFYYSKEELISYLEDHKLPNELNYFDPTKMFENQECGLHLANI